jgi:hypothetical protein
LHQELTEEIVEDGFQFYATFFNAPPAIKVGIPLRAVMSGGCSSSQAVLHGFMGVGILGLVAKLHKYDESAIFFDGSSLGRSQI